MLDFIYDGFISWLESQISSLLNWIVSSFTGLLGCSMNTFDQYFPFAVSCYKYFVYMGVGICFAILLLQLLRSMAGPLSEGSENPIALTIRSIMCVALICFAQGITDYILKLANTPYTWVSNLTYKTLTVNSAVDFDKVKNLMTELGCTGLLIIIVLIAIGWNFFKVLLEAAERYIVVGLLKYTAPLAFSMGGSKNTSGVLKGWVKMIGSQIFLLIMNVWFLKVLLSAFYAVSFTDGKTQPTVSTFGSTTTAQKGGLVFWCIMVLAMCKAAQKIDSYMASMGMTVAQTGGALLDDMIAAGSAIKSVAKGASKAAKGISHLSGNSKASAGLSSVLRKSATAAALSGISNRSQKGTANGIKDAAATFGAKQAFEAATAKAGGVLSSKAIGEIARGTAAVNGVIKDSESANKGSESLGAYIPSLKSNGIDASKQFKDVSIGDGKITGQSLNPNTGKYEGVKLQSDVPDGKEGTDYKKYSAADGSIWYKKIGDKADTFGSGTMAGGRALNNANSLSGNSAGVRNPQASAASKAGNIAGGHVQTGFAGGSSKPLSNSGTIHLQQNSSTQSSESHSPSAAALNDGANVTQPLSGSHAYENSFSGSPHSHVPSSNEGGVISQTIGGGHISGNSGENMSYSSSTVSSGSQAVSQPVAGGHVSDNSSRPAYSQKPLSRGGSGGTSYAGSSDSVNHVNGPRRNRGMNIPAKFRNPQNKKKGD